MATVTIRPVHEDEREWVLLFMDIHWGSERVVSRGKLFLPHELPGFVAESEGERVGLATYHIENGECQIVTMNSLEEGRRIGTQLLETVKEAAKDAGCDRLWLITTNDNLDALAFFQKRGMVLAALHKNALELSRMLKPEIPIVGNYGIPLRDELELEMAL